MGYNLYGAERSKLQGRQQLAMLIPTWEAQTLCGNSSMHLQFHIMCHSIPHATYHAATQLPAHLNISDQDQPHVHPTQAHSLHAPTNQAT